MKHRISAVNIGLVLFAIVVMGLASAPAEASKCSAASVAGDWAYTYTGTIFTPGGPVPAASVGHYRQDASGKVVGSQSRSVAGLSGVEDISGNVTVHPDCTASATINVLVNGQLQRTDEIAVVYDNNG